MDKKSGQACRLWYRQPAKKWTEALPVGNGRLGAMVFGGIREDLLQLNEDTLWAGYTRDDNNPQAKDALASVRKLVFEGKYPEAQDLVESKMLGPYTQPYQPMGNLRISFPHTEEACAYVRRMATLALHPASPRCCCKAMTKQSICCRHSRPTGQTVRSVVCARVGDTLWISSGKKAHWQALVSGRTVGKILLCGMHTVAW